MNGTDFVTQVIPSVVSGATLFGLTIMVKSRNSMGERLGKLEKEADEKRGYDRGFKEGRRARAARVQ